MKIEILGMKVRVEVIVACILLGMLIHGLLFCSCSRVGVVEAMQILSSEAGVLSKADWDKERAAGKPYYLINHKQYHG
jgi:hypothetical protein